MSARLEAVMFDAGGVLWDLEPPVEALFAAALSRRGVSVDGAVLREAVKGAERLLDEDFARLEGGDEGAYWTEYDGLVLGELGVRVDVDEFARELSREFRGVATREESWVPFPDAVPALEAVRGSGLRTCLVSNATELARRVLRRLDMERLFDVVVISEEVGVRKPDPRIFRLALDEAGVEPSEAVYLGDRPATDMVGATRAGMRAVLVDRRGTYPGAPYERVDGLAGIEDLLRRLRSRPAPGASGASGGSCR